MQMVPLQPKTFIFSKDMKVIVWTYITKDTSCGAQTEVDANGAFTT